MNVVTTRKLEVYSNPPPGYAVQAALLYGPLPGPTFTPEGDYFEYAQITPATDLWIATDQPVTVSLGAEDNNTYVASWYDPLARPRRITGLNGVTVSVRLTRPGIICTWGAQSFLPGGAVLP